MKYSGIYTGISRKRKNESTDVRDLVCIRYEPPLLGRIKGKFVHDVIYTCTTSKPVRL